ncbi:LmbU family transcriptional regulator [Actinomadura chibensis]|uniref:LmbU and cloE n=1 Tax=Actinomadura chibensis TaxID=392828 RepID=A0A5D0NPA5_9ACTN|nr:LmbU family transcriptional regulator [Actinomadura chibensis]TYB46393.1 hypothetical protein FXF69_14135 [Actinomadura chibensis]
MATAAVPTPSPRPVDPRATTTPTSLSLPGGMPIEEWRSIGERIHAISEASTWWLGDWLLYGQNRYPNRYRRAVEETGLDYQTLRNYVWVARKFPPSRRRAKLSLQHHLEVAALPEEEQDVWLGRAERFGWSKTLLRRYVKASRGELAEGETGAVQSKVTLNLKIAPDRCRVWRRAAIESGTDLIDWISSILDSASGLQPAPAAQHPQGQGASHS